MSREERRQYQRMMKNMERGPALPPAARARAQRIAGRRAARAQQRSHAFTTGYWVRTVLLAAAAGFLGFSLQWPSMPFALYVGLAVAAVAFLVLLGIRLLQRRASTPS